MVQWVKNPPANAGEARDGGAISVEKIPLEDEIATHSSILSWEDSMDSPWGHQESDMIE